MTDPDTSRPALRPRAIAATAVAVVALIPIVVALLLPGGGEDPSAGRPAVTSAVAKPFVPVITRKASPVSDRRLPVGAGTLVAIVQHPTQIRTRPGGGHLIAKVKTTTEFGSTQTFSVVRLSGAWLGVVSDLIGNDRVGWIPASSSVLIRDHWELKASLRKRQLTVLHNGRPIERYSIAVGAPAAPTPVGRFAVTDRLKTGDPSGPYGCCILALTAKAPHAIQDWSGGDRIAIHSTPEIDSIGKPVSHGCMRLSLAEGRWLLSHIPLGTPTLVST